MRGRDLFVSAKPLLNGVAALLRVVPKPLLVWAWQLTDWLPELVGIAARYCMLKRLARSCGDNVLVGRNVEIRHWERLSIGSNVSIHKQCYVDAYGEVLIEDDVSIAHQTSIVSFQHTWKDPGLPIRDNAVLSGMIWISRDVWIGCGVRIMAGVTIGSRSVVAAGAVVTKNIGAGTVAAGVPARPVKSIGIEPKPHHPRQHG